MGEGFSGPKWQLPSEGQLKCAQGLLQRFLIAGCEELEDLCSSGGGGVVFGSHAHRIKLNVALYKVS